MSRLFLSHARRDVAVVRELTARLAALGHEVFHDERSGGDQEWWDDLVARIGASDVFVPVLSPAYVASTACRLEARQAGRAGVSIRPVDLGGVDPEECEPEVARATWLRFEDADAARLATLAGTVAPVSARAPATIPVRRPPSLPPVAAPPAAPAAPEPAAAAPLDRRLVAGLVVLVLVVVVAGWVLTHRGDDSPGPSAQQGRSTSAAGAASAGADARSLLRAVTRAAAGAPRHPLPAASCRTTGAGEVTCTDPTPAIAAVTFRSYPSTRDLYDAYVAAAEQASGSPFVANVRDCSQRRLDGELSWNGQRRHSREFTLDQAIAGGLDPTTEAAGRVFCVAADDAMTMVWTQDPGLLGVVTGDKAGAVVAWWTQVHRLFH